MSCDLCFADRALRAIRAKFPKPVVGARQSGIAFAKRETYSPAASPAYCICPPHGVGEAMGEIAIRWAKITPHRIAPTPVAQC